MRLKPLDIRQQQFRKSLWGLDAPAVEAFLEVMAHDFEGVIRETQTLREELQRRESELTEHRERERTLKETMLTAARITEDIKQNARKEAELVIAQAESQAEHIIQNAHTRLVRLIEDIDELRRQKAQFEASLRSTVNAHGKLLDAMNERQAPAESDMLSSVPRAEPVAPRESTTLEMADTAYRDLLDDGDLVIAPNPN